jgi:hypothetical protein
VTSQLQGGGSASSIPFWTIPADAQRQFERDSNIKILNRAHSHCERAEQKSIDSRRILAMIPRNPFLCDALPRRQLKHASHGPLRPSAWGTYQESNSQ